MSVRITGMTVCVNYSDLLERSVSRWQSGLERMIVITSSSDIRTIELCRKHNLEVHVTDVFYENGAKFNKGAAMSEAVFCKNIRTPENWILTFDSDMVPPDDWREKIEEFGLKQGFLYGTRRWQQPESAVNPTLTGAKLMPQHWVIGFFTLFHSDDPHLPPYGEYLFDIHWPHAGNYDTQFTRRWPSKNARLLPLKMIHLGEERANWTGRGNKAELKKIINQRKTPVAYRHEQMPVPPDIRKFA